MLINDDSYQLHIDSHLSLVSQLSHRPHSHGAAVYPGSKLLPSPIRRLNPRRPRPPRSQIDRGVHAAMLITPGPGRCVGMLSVAYAARISVTERSKSAKENECVATSCMIFRWDVLMCRIHTWDWLRVLRFALQNLPPAGRLQCHAESSNQVQTVMRASLCSSSRELLSSGKLAIDPGN